MAGSHEYGVELPESFRGLKPTSRYKQAAKVYANTLHPELTLTRINQRENKAYGYMEHRFEYAKNSKKKKGKG